MRLNTKTFKDSINKLFQDTWAKKDFERISKNEEQALINLIYVQEGLVVKEDMYNKPLLSSQ